MLDWELFAVADRGTFRALLERLLFVGTAEVPFKSHWHR